MSDWKGLIHPLATAVGFMGGFPDPPQEFKDLTQNELFRWLMVFILIWQGGGAQDLQLSALVTGICYLVVKIMEMRRTMQQIVSVANAPAVVPPPPATDEMPKEVKEQFYYY